MPSVNINATMNEVEHVPSKHNPLFDVIPGQAGGAARVLVGQPFDTLKTRMQVLAKGTIGAQGMPPEMVYTSNMDCLRKMVTQEGAMSLYKGTVAPLIGNMILLGIHFPTFSHVRKDLEEYRNVPHGKFDVVNVAIGGAAAGAAGSLISCPSEMVRTLMVMQRRTLMLEAARAKSGQSSGPPAPTYKGSLDAARQVLSKHGIKGLYRGYTSTLAREVVGYAGFFVAYEASLSAMVQPGQTKGDLSFLQVMSAGVMAGFGLWGSMFPIDTIKTRMQADNLAAPQYKNTMECINMLVKNEGATSAYRGMSAALLRAIPVNAAICLAVEATRIAMHPQPWDVEVNVNAPKLATAAETQSL